MFTLSPMEASPSIDSVLFSTGTDSPVSAASCTFRLMASVRRRSAGMLSPVSISTMSPGTSSRDSMMRRSPSRTTLQRGAAMRSKASSDRSAFDSCTMPMMALATRMTRMMSASVMPSPFI